jgi:hypothetical protein
LHQNLSTYKNVTGQLKSLSVEQFIDHYNDQPIQRYLSDEMSVKSNVYSIACETYIKHDAQKLGVINSEKFILDKRNYTNEVVFNTYESSLIGNSLPDDKEINETYQKTREQFAVATDTRYSIYTFAQPQEAFMARIKLYKSKADTAILEHLIRSDLHISLKTNGYDMTDTLQNELFKMKIGQISIPKKVNNLYVVIRKEDESGRRIKDLKEVKKEVSDIIKAEKTERAKQIKIGQLVKLYAREDHIDYDSLLKPDITNKYTEPQLR